MKQLKYHVLWPGGNTTAIVTDKIPRKLHAGIANKIMKADPSIEQVGYLEKPRSRSANTRLQMMGGEFCGNATRSAAFFWAWQVRETGGKKVHQVRMEASGLPEILKVAVSTSSADITLPGDFFVSIKKISKGFIVDLRGIRHIILFTKGTMAHAKKMITAHKGKLPAVGVIYSNLRGGRVAIKPLIWVRETDSFVPETGCASGSIAAAIAAYTVQSGKRKTYSVIQPSKIPYQVILKPVRSKSAALASKKPFSEIVIKGRIKYAGVRSITL